MVLERGQVLAHRYRIDRLLASGGTGHVYKALDEKLGRPVAVKVFPTRSEVYAREAQVAASLSHPNIVSLIDFVESEPFAYLVMEYIEGETLADLLARRNRLAIDEAIQVGIELSRALAYAHRRGVVHRDLNPNNVMVGSDGRIQLMDFGMALQSGIPLEGTSVFGTPAYMPPERLMGMTGDSRCDQYALGMLLYQMLTGDLPYQGSTVLAMAQQILSASPVWIRIRNADVLVRLENVVMQLIEKNPAARFQDMDEVRLHLERSRRSSWLPLGTNLILPSAEDLPALDEIQTHIEHALAMEHGAILILASGMNAEKLAIVQHLRQQGVQTGIRVLYGQAEGNARDYPHYLFREVLRDCLEARDLATTAECLSEHLSDAQLLPFLLRLAGFSFETQQVYEHVDLEASTQKSLSLQALRDWLVGQSAEIPVLLILDELQNIDSDSLNLLLELLDLAEEHPVLFLCSYRPDHDSRCNLILATAQERHPHLLRQVDMHRSMPSNELRRVIRYDHLGTVRYGESRRLDFRGDDWEFHENDGAIHIGEDGSLTLSTPRIEGDPCTFPFVRTKQNPFPEGNFVVRLQMQYLDSLQNGAGFQVCSTPPNNQCDSPVHYAPVLSIWQDHSSHQRLFFRVADRSVYFLSESPDLQTHEYELRFSMMDSTDPCMLHFFFDGQMACHTWHLRRPDAMWFGQYMPDRTSLGWSDLRVDWIEVAPLT